MHKIKWSPIILISIFALISIFPNYTYAQNNEEKALTDKDMVIGFIQNDYAGKSVDQYYCMTESEKYFSDTTAVLVSGVSDCRTSYSNSLTNFYEITYNGKTYYIEKEKLKFLDKDPYVEINSFTPEQAETFRKIAQEISTALYKQNIQKALKFLDGCKTKGLAILTWSYYDESEHTEGTSASIEVYNPTTKTIKYIWITFVGFNPVGDKVVDRKRKTSNITVQGVGPIEPKGSAKYQYKYVWFTDLVTTAKITIIKVQYMDGSIKTISNPKGIMLAGRLYSVISED